MQRERRKLAKVVSVALVAQAIALVLVSRLVWQQSVTIRELQTANRAQQVLNANVRILEVTAEAVGERVALHSEQITAIRDELHTLVVVVGREVLPVTRRTPLTGAETFNRRNPQGLG